MANGYGSFEDMFKKFDEIQITRTLPTGLDGVPSGSYEFREAKFLCDASHQTRTVSESIQEEEEPQGRQRSQTIDSTYGKRRAHVRFRPNLVGKSNNANSNENDKPHGILRHGNGAHDNDDELRPHQRRRSNTIETVSRGTHVIKGQIAEEPAEIATPMVNGDGKLGVKNDTSKRSPSPQRKQNGKSGSHRPPFH